MSQKHARQTFACNTATPVSRSRVTLGSRSRTLKMKFANVPGTAVGNPFPGRVLSIPFRRTSDIDCMPRSRQRSRLLCSGPRDLQCRKGWRGWDRRREEAISPDPWLTGRRRPKTVTDSPEYLKRGILQVWRHARDDDAEVAAHSTPAMPSVTLCSISACTTSLGRRRPQLCRAKFQVLPSSQLLSAFSPAERVAGVAGVAALHPRADEGRI